MPEITSLAKKFRSLVPRMFFNMHYVTIAVLVVVGSAASIGRGFPVNLFVAVLAASALDVAIKRFWLKKASGAPLSAIITGLIIGSVSVNTQVFGVLVAVVLAILSKFIIRTRNSHIFNPAVFGVVASQVFNPAAHSAAANAIAHGSSQAVEGFGLGGFAVSIALVPLLLFASHRAGKLWASVPFLAATALLFNFTGLASPDSLNAENIFSFLETLPYYFAFIIVSEPRTSPHQKNEQVVFGIGIAILAVLATIISGSHVGALVALLFGNLVFAAYNAWAGANAKHSSPTKIIR